MVTRCHFPYGATRLLKLPPQFKKLPARYVLIVCGENTMRLRRARCVFQKDKLPASWFLDLLLSLLGYSWPGFRN